MTDNSALTHPELALDRQLCFSLYRASRAVTRMYQPLLQELGLTYPQYLVMLVLWEAQGPCPMGELARRLDLDSGTLTPLLRRLQHLGLLTRERDTQDERRVLVTLTADGLELRERAAPIPGELIRLAHAPGVDAATLKQQADHLTETLEKYAQA